MHSFFQVTTRRKNRCYFNTNKEGAYIRGAYTRMYLFVYSRTPLPPPPLRLVYRDRPITGEAYKNVCVCVCVLGGGGGGVGVAYKRNFMVFALKRLSTVSSKNKERKHK